MFSELKQASIIARKAKAPEARFLSTFISEISMRAKNDGNREVTNEDIFKTAQKFIKSATETKKLMETAGMDTSESDMELIILDQYVPKVMSEDQTREAVQKVILQVGPNMGAALGALKREFGTDIDMQLASRFVKELVG